MSRSFPLSRETVDVLREHPDFLESVRKVTAELNKEIDPKLPREKQLRPLLGDPKAATRVSVGSTGHVQIDFIYPFDNNDKAEDGRIYMKDRFIFDPTLETLERYWRSFDYTGGDSWKAWAERYRATVQDRKVEDLEPGIQEAATRIGQSFGRPISQGLLQRIQKQSQYLKPAYQALRAHGNWNFRIKDEQNFFTLMNRGDKLQLTFAFVVDNDKDAKNGRIFLYDKFTLNGTTWGLEKVERDWRVGPEGEAAQQEELKQLVMELKGGGSPGLEAARPFVEAMLGEVAGPVEVAPDEFTRLFPPIPDTIEKRQPTLLDSNLSWHQAEFAQDRKKRGEIEEEIRFSLNSELEEKRADRERGWAPAFLKGGKNPSEELIQKLRSICEDPNAETRTEQLLRFARQDLLIGNDLPKTAQVVAMLAKETGQAPRTRREAESLLALAQGRGKVGAEAELLASKAMGDLLGAGLMGMVAAPFGGTALQGLVLAPLQRTNFLGFFLSVVAGTLGEAATFSGVRRIFASALHNPAELLNPRAIFAESSQMIVPFMGLHSAHLIASRFGSFLAESRMLRPLLSTGEEPILHLAFPFLPSRHAFLLPFEAVPLTTWGERLVVGLHHGLGFTTLLAVEGVRHRTDPQQGFADNFFAAALTYLQAVAGFKLADGLTFGRLQNTLGELGLRLTLRRLETTRPRIDAEPSPMSRTRGENGDRRHPDYIIPGSWHPRNGTPPEPPPGLSLQTWESLLANERLVRTLPNDLLEISLQGQGRGNLVPEDFWDFWQLALHQARIFRDKINFLRERQAMVDNLAYVVGRVETRLSHALRDLHQGNRERAEEGLGDVEQSHHSLAQGIAYTAEKNGIGIDPYHWGESGPRVIFRGENHPILPRTEARGVSSASSAEPSGVSSISSLGASPRIHPAMLRQIDEDRRHFEQRLAGEISGLTHKLEGVFRGGGRVREREGGHYELVGRDPNIPGVNIERVSAEAYHAYLAWMQQRGFWDRPESRKGGKFDAYDNGLGVTDKGSIWDWGRSTGLHITGSSQFSQLAYIHALLVTLPETMWQARSPDGRPYLEGIWLCCDSSAGDNPAQFSLLEKGTIHLSREILDGPRHLLMAAILREMGRATAHRYRLEPRPGGPERLPAFGWLEEESPWDIPPDASIPLRLRQHMHEAVRQVTRAEPEETSRAFDLGPFYHRFYPDAFEGFMGDFHLHYFAQGRHLREHIQGIGSGNIRKAYEFIYHELQRRVFGGREYP